MNNLAKISLEEMEFHAFHGCLEHEKKLGNTFIVSLCFQINTQLASTTDRLSDTLNYQLVYDLVKKEMEIPAQLIEHLAQRILNNVFDTFSEIHHIELTLKKLNPPLGGKVGSVSIQIEKERPF